MCQYFKHERVASLFNWVTFEVLFLIYLITAQLKTSVSVPDHTGWRLDWNGFGKSSYGLIDVSAGYFTGNTKENQDDSSLCLYSKREPS